MQLPELTLITPSFANGENSNLEIFSKNKNAGKNKKPVIHESFFFMWIPLLNSQSEIDFLNKAIEKYFPQIPIEKALTCKMNLIYPIEWVLQNQENLITESNTIKIPNNNDGVLIQTIGKMIPVSLSNLILLDIPLIKYAFIKISSIKNQFSNSVYFWSLGLKLALQLISEGNFIPVVKKFENGKTGNVDVEFLTTYWRPILRSIRDFENFGKIVKFAPLSAYSILNNGKIIDPTILLTEYLNLITDTLIRNAAKKENYNPFSRIYGMSPKDTAKLGKKMSWEIRMLSTLIISNPKFRIYNLFEEPIPDIVKKWVRPIDHPYWKDGYNITLELNLPKKNTEEWILSYYIQDIANKGTLIPLKKFWELYREKNSTLDQEDLRNLNVFKSKFTAQKEIKWRIRRNILSALYILGKMFPPIIKSLEEENPGHVAISISEATDFIEYIGNQMKEDGFNVILPDVFAEGGKQRLKTVMRIKSEKSLTPEMEQAILNNMDIGPIRKYKESFDINSILAYNWEIQIGDEPLNDSEFNNLLQKNQPLIFWKDQWILLDRTEVNTIKSTFTNKRQGKIKAEKALFLGLTGQAYMEKESAKNNKKLVGDRTKRKIFSKKTIFGPYKVVLEGPIKDIVNVLTGKNIPQQLLQPKDLKGTLREYQLKGFNWLTVMTGMGFNLCLADDMGLGKTVQVISYLLQKVKNMEEEKKKLKALVVCPTSVLSNWGHEIKKFAPNLKVGFYYGTARPSDLNSLTKFVEENVIIISTYGLLRRDIDLLSLINWDSAILDEAQNIKNFQAQQTKAAYNLKAHDRICLTGTPIENHLMELWSIFHFLSPFLLNTRTSFLKRYVIPIERLGNSSTAKQLQKLMHPFLLRRLKRDKNIIKDLPEKQEIKMFVTLSKVQKQLYSQIVSEEIKLINELDNRISNSDKSENKTIFQRNGLILNTIMKLKQVCNHPSQALHQEIDNFDKINLNDFISASGKLQRLLEMLEELIESGDKILIFTQFKVMGSILEKTIIESTNITPLFLHGGTSQKAREKMVANFQDDVHYRYPVFILSLKAGGTGLNLTAASNVLHFDRWWNPSVENQATDRAYRIGQSQNVMVYKMISVGTIEEKIDKMIEDKKELAEKIIAASGSEQWITDLSTDELKELFTLEEGIIHG